jgi:hypothetical protein
MYNKFVNMASFLFQSESLVQQKARHRKPFAGKFPKHKPFGLKARVAAQAFLSRQIQRRDIRLAEKVNLDGISILRKAR